MYGLESIRAANSNCGNCGKMMGYHHLCDNSLMAQQQQKVREIEALTFQQIKRNTLIAVAATKR